MALIGGFLGTDMLREEIAVTRETAARYQPDGRRARGHDACRLADKIRTVRRPGEDSDYDTYVDRWFAERLAAALEVSKKMVENAGSI